jgi:hypothetical protein
VVCKKSEGVLGMPLSDDYYKKVLDNLYDGIYLLDENRNIINMLTATGFPFVEIPAPCRRLLKMAAFVK